MFYGLKYTNDLGASILFGGDDYKVIEFEGFGDVQADIQTQKSPYQDGSSHIDTTLRERPIYISFAIIGDVYKDLRDMRRHIGSVFNPKIGGKLTISFDGEDYEINCQSEHVPHFPDGGTDAVGRMQIVNVDLICPDPYWKSPSITEEPAFEPLFQFPFEGCFEMGIQRDQRIIFNDGDAPAPIQVEFFGPALNPKIINNTTGEYIKVNQMLEENEKMIIDTTDGIKSVCFVDENHLERNVFNWIDLGSTFFDLIIGENDIEYTADSDVQGTVVNISYNKKFTSV